MENAIELLKTLDYGSKIEPLKEIDDAIAAAHNDAEATKKIEHALLGVLKDGSSLNGKDYACRKLKLVAGKDSVEVLAGMLGDEKHSHMARFVLQAMPGAEAGQALIASLSKLSGSQQAGVIGSLGCRQDESAVSALATLLGGSDGAAANAAAKALGAIRSKAAGKALAEAKPHADAAAHATDAMFACAEGLLASGDKVSALSIYKKLASGSPPKHVKLAATRGMLACAGKKSA